MSWNRKNRWWIVLIALGLTLGACGDEEDGAENDGDDEENVVENDDIPEEAFFPPLEDLDALMEGTKSNADLPEEAKADETFPAQFDLMDTQSPVSNQQSRGVCSVFSTVALMEHLYIKAGVYDEPNFSEQYLQWSVKKEVGSFPNSSGSNANFNLQAISQYGIVAEEYWPYEGQAWGTSDHEDCQGDDRPTFCHTNGSPPQEALDAPKYQLPHGRWISTRERDIKAHMRNRGKAVVVGGDFYYQSWNHGASDLPTNRDYFRKGYVPYPNDADKESSRENPAGHSILLVGWDDDLEVERLDENGEVKLDENGEPLTEKGFFIFKNSWGTGSFGVDNPYGDGYGYISYEYVREFKSGRVASLPEPHHIPDPDEPLECTDTEWECDNQCVPVDEFNCGGCGDVCADGEICEEEVCVAHEAEEDTFEWTGSESAIPDNDPDGLIAEIEVDGSGIIERLEAEVWIEHTYNGDIQIDLIGPNGEEVRLREADGSSGWDIIETYEVDEFVGEESAGTWQLKIVDTALFDEGDLVAWYLRITR